MGLDQKIIKVDNTDLEKFYVINNRAIIAPHNPDLNHDYINTTAVEYQDLEESYNKALGNDHPDAYSYREQMNELVKPYSEDDNDIWLGRKENHIHQWVINTHSIDETNLDYVLIDPQALLDDLETVIENPDRASEVMSTRSGFFFGGTEYDECYFDSVKALHEVLTEEKNQGNFDNHSYFYWSWW